MDLRLWQEGLIRSARTLAAAALGLFLATCSQVPSLLAQIKDLGELRVAMRNSPTVYYQGADGPTGFEYDLARDFAQHLGVELQVVVPDSFDRIIPMVRERRVHMAAAGLTVTRERRRLVDFGPPVQEVRQQLVFGPAAEDRPDSLGDLDGGSLEVVKGSSHAERLHELKREHPRLTWTENSRFGSDGLLYRVSEGKLAYTVADSNQVLLSRRYYPGIRVAFNIGEPEKLAWAFRPAGDGTLERAAKRFLEQYEKRGRLAELKEHHYGHADRLNHVDSRLFAQHMLLRLPRYIEAFRDAAERAEMDWRLLAAIGYQESHWNPHAVSYTGVRGIMMLTRDTARSLDIENRRDPFQSIRGGARYFARVKSKLPGDIAEPDRTWMALAAYNVGLGHLEDARRITERQGGDPHSWADVRERLPLLAQPRWYRQTRYGFARGWEPVKYVANIRGFYDILVWLTDNMDGGKQRDEELLPVTSRNRGSGEDERNL